MTEKQMSEWAEFEKTGRIDAYLRYRESRRTAADGNFSLEVGEEIGVSENRGNCHQGHKIR